MRWKRTICPIDEFGELLVKEKADVGRLRRAETLGKVTMSEVKRSNESQSSLKYVKPLWAIRWYIAMQKQEN